MRSLLVQLGIGALVLFALATFLFEPPANSQAGATEVIPTPQPAFTEEALLHGASLSRIAFVDCTGDLAACLRDTLKSSGEPQPVLDFFDANQAMLLGFEP